MRFFGKENGVVTVMVVMIMIPVVFFTGFLGDLARLKLAGDQAVMAADTYGEALLSCYDNALKELYGIFAISQSEDGKKKIDEFDKYVKSSFYPGNNIIGPRYTANALAGSNTPWSTPQYDGFQPFGTANVELRYDTVTNSSLANPAVLATQISSFMKYRIVSQVLDSGFMDVIDQIKNNKLNMEVAQKKSELDEEVEDFLELAKEYYQILKEICIYPEFAYNVWDWYAYFTGRFTMSDSRTINKSIASLISTMDESGLNEDLQKGIFYILFEECYESIKKYKGSEKEKYDAFYEIEFPDDEESDASEENEEYGESENALEDEINREYHDCFVDFWFINEQLTGQILQNGLSDKEVFVSSLKEKITESEEDSYDPWYNLGLYKPALLEMFKELPNVFKYIVNNTPPYGVGNVGFSNFDDRADALKEKAEEIRNQKQKIEDKKAELESKLGKEGVDSNLKSNIEEELKDFNEIFKHIDDFVPVAEIYYNRTGNNDAAKQRSGEMIDSVERACNVFLNCSYETGLNKEQFYSGINCSDNFIPNYLVGMDTDFRRYSEFKKYLDDLFAPQPGSNDEKANEKKEESEKKRDEAQNGCQKDDSEDPDNHLNLRDFPSGKTDNSASFSFDFTDFSELIGNFNLENLGNFGEELLVKLFNTEYAFGMFSSRVTNVKVGQDNPDDDNDSFEKQGPKKSITGFEMSRSTNYLFNSELEYLYAGKEESWDNLDDTRNLILAFRAMMNFVSTYTISELNKTIKALGNIAPHPILKFVVIAIARIAVTAIETYADWNNLKSGDSAILYKSKLEHLTSYDDIKGWLGLEDKEEDGNSGIKLTYENYLMIMLLFFTADSDMYSRIGDLIELNVNAVRCQIGEEGDLKYPGEVGSENAKTMIFNLDDAYTAVDATCSVQMDFLVMPSSFARLTLKNEDRLNELEKFEKQRYNFTVTRGY